MLCLRFAIATTCPRTRVLRNRVPSSYWWIGDERHSSAHTHALQISLHRQKFVVGGLLVAVEHVTLCVHKTPISNRDQGLSFTMTRFTFQTFIKEAGKDGLSV